MNFDCWAVGTWAAGTWVEGSWCPGGEPPAPPIQLFSSQLSTGYLIDWRREEEEILFL